MKKYEYISFDLQGTLSDSRFSDEFWMELLPKLYAKTLKLSEKEAKLELASFFRSVGPYDYRYYDWRYWATKLNLSLSFDDLVGGLRHKPLIFPSMRSLIEELHHKALPLLIISSTTNDFIQEELGDLRPLFTGIFSSLDDLGIAGKPAHLYTEICKTLRVDPHSVLHIGDSQVMDVINASNAGLDSYFMDRSVKPDEHVAKLRRDYNL